MFVSRRLQDMLNNDYKSARGSKVLLLGVTYKANISDRRESPAVPLAQRLLGMGCTLQYHDPYVREWAVDGTTVPGVQDIEQACREADAVIIVQAHRAYLENSDAIVSSGTPTLDATGRFSGATISRL